MRAGTAAKGALVATILGLASACDAPARTEATAERSAAATIAPSSRARAAPSAEAPVDAKAWTDPAAIERLANDCRWAPADDPAAEKPGPLSCAMGVAEQSCVPDPCFEARERECAPACTRTCDDCADTCGARCEACKAPCADDACRRACATECGTCRQACLVAKDHCATARCRAEQRACDTKLAVDWTQGGCTAACQRFRACSACEQDFESAACLKCRARAMGQCPARFEMMCAFGVDPTRPDR